MSDQVLRAPIAAEGLQRLFDFPAEQDQAEAERAQAEIGPAIEVLQTFPFHCRKVSPENPLLRELVIVLEVAVMSRCLKWKTSKQ